MLSEFTKRLQMLSRQQLAVGAALVALAGAALYGVVHISGTRQGHSEVSSQSRKGLQRYIPTPAEWASLTIQPVTERAFRAEHVTEGKIAVDEDRSTPVFSTYAGRVIKLLARPGESVTQGQPLFVIEAAPLKDYQQAEATLIQAQNDLRSTQTALEAARNKLRILGFTDEAISTFQERGRINREPPIFSPTADRAVKG